MNGTGAFGLLDRYVLRRFAAAYGLCLFGFVLLFLVMDFFAKLDDFAKAEKAIAAAGYTLSSLVFEYYATKLPLILTSVGPYLTLFAAIATLITFARHNELTPMIAAGRSHHRVLAPVYAFAILVVFGLVAAEEYALPSAMKRHAALDGIIDGGEKGEARKPPHLRDPQSGNVFDARLWYPSRQRLVKVYTPRYHDPSGRVPDGVLEAAEIAYRRNPATNEKGWFPVEATLTPIVTEGGGVLPPPIRLPPDQKLAFALTPQEVDLLTASGEPGLTRVELAKLRKRYPERFDLDMQAHTRTTRPVSSLILLVFGLPFVTRTGQRTIAAGLSVALGTCLAYVFVDFLFRELGNRGDLAPLVCAWFAPALFGAIGLARIDRISE